MKRITAILLACIMTLALFSGCGKDENLPVVRINDDAVEVSVEEVMFYVFNMQAQYENDYGSEILYQEVGEGQTLGDQLKKEALDSAVVVNLCAYMAEQEGITLDEEVRKKAKEDAVAYFEALDPDTISQYNFSRELFEEVFVEYEIRNAVMAHYADNAPADDEKLEENLEYLAQMDPYFAAIRELGVEKVAEKIRARHILILTKNAEGNDLSEEEKEAAYERILEVQQKLEDGEDFVSLVAEYSEDPGSVNTGGEYTFTRGQMVSEFEDTALSLEPGEISDIVETEYGYHIILLEEKNIAPTEEEIAEVEAYEEYSINYAKNALAESAFEDMYEQWTLENDIQINQGIWNDVIIKGQSMDQSEETPAE